MVKDHSDGNHRKRCRFDKQGKRGNQKLRTTLGDRGDAVVKVLCYKSEGRWFDSR